MSENNNNTAAGPPDDKDEEVKKNLNVELSEDEKSVLKHRGRFYIGYGYAINFAKYLSYEQIGRIFAEIIDYSWTLKCPPPCDDPVVTMGFQIAAEVIKSEAISYISTSHKRSKSGKKGGESKARNARMAEEDIDDSSKIKQMLANASEDNDTDTDMSRPDNDSKNRESLSRLMNRYMSNGTDEKKQYAAVTACLRARFGAYVLLSGKKEWDKRNRDTLIRAAKNGILDELSEDQINDVIQFIDIHGFNENNYNSGKSKADNEIDCGIMAYEIANDPNYEGGASGFIEDTVENDKEDLPDNYEEYAHKQ